MLISSPTHLGNGKVHGATAQFWPRFNVGSTSTHIEMTEIFGSDIVGKIANIAHKLLAAVRPAHIRVDVRLAARTAHWAFLAKVYHLDRGLEGREVSTGGVDTTVPLTSIERGSASG